MRLWHKDFIHVLPNQQLLGQWRECVAIARNIAVKGTPNHLLVNKVMDYPKWHLMAYTIEVCTELEKRGYRVDRQRFFQWFDQWKDGTVKTHDIEHYELFGGWHNDKYFRQCYYNLQEKHDCGGISILEWNRIVDVYDYWTIHEGVITGNGK